MIVLSLRYGLLKKVILVCEVSLMMMLMVES